MFANYLIGLREGLEAGLIVGILIAFAVKSGRKDVLPKLWLGVGIAVVVMLAVGAALTWGPYGLTDEAQEAIGGALSLLAVALVTWMIFWMNANAAEMAGDLRGKLSNAMTGAGYGIVIVAMVSVMREGIETALFVWAATQSSGGGTALGAFLGILTAVVLSWLIYRGLIRINLRTFFAWTGAFLIVVAAGVLAYAVHEFQEVGVLPEGDAVYSLASILPVTSPLGAFIAGVFNFRPEPTLLEIAAWWAYVLVVGGLFARQILRRPVRPAPQQTAESAPVTVSAS
ncbi:MAG: iron uptake transporter permease EfeU [Agromyces sp.]